jgi:hypothetical protein
MSIYLKRKFIIFRVNWKKSAYDLKFLISYKF